MIGALAPLQRRQQLVGQAPAAPRTAPAPRSSVQLRATLSSAVFTVGRRRGARGAQRAAIEFGRVHLARARHQVVRFVDQHADAPLVGQRHARTAWRCRRSSSCSRRPPRRSSAPAPAQVVGADLVRQRRPRAAPSRSSAGTLQRRAARGRQAVVEALGQRAGVAMAGLVRVLAGLVARDQFQHPQRQHAARCARSSRPRPAPAGGPASWRPGRTPCRALRRRRLEHREQGADGLADAGGRLRQHAAAAGVGLVDRLGQVALAGAEVGMRERQRRQRRVARRRGAPAPARPRPGSARTGRRRCAASAGGAAVSRSTVSVCVPMSKYTSARLTSSRPRCLAQQLAVDPRLRPVQVAVVGGHAAPGRRGGS